MVKKHKKPIVIGRGLFSNEPVQVEMKEIDGNPTFFLTPMTASTVAKLEESGVEFSDETSTMQTLDAAQKICAELLHGWEGVADEAGNEIEFSPHNRDRLAEVGDVVAEIISAASNLAAHRQEGEEKNSENSFAGTSVTAASH